MLLAELIHNYGDALTAVPLGIAFLLRSPRAERFAGRFVVAAIFVSACVAGYEAIVRIIDPTAPDHLHRFPDGDDDRRGDDGEGEVGVMAVGDQGRAVEALAGTGAHAGGDHAAEVPERAGDRERDPVTMLARAGQWTTSLIFLAPSC